MQTFNCELFVQVFAEAVAAEEGFFDRKRIPTIPQRLNNPLCLRHWKNAAGAPYSEINGFVNFPDVEAGWAAGYVQCKINILKRGLTFKEFFNGKPGVYDGFAPARDKHNPLAYAQKVLLYLSHKLRITEPVTLDTQIKTLIDPATVQGARR